MKYKAVLRRFEFIGINSHLKVKSLSCGYTAALQVIIYNYCCSIIMFEQLHLANYTLYTRYLHLNFDFRCVIVVIGGVSV